MFIETFPTPKNDIPCGQNCRKSSP